MSQLTSHDVDGCEMAALHDTSPRYGDTTLVRATETVGVDDGKKTTLEGNASFLPHPCLLTHTPSTAETHKGCDSTPFTHE